VINFKPAGAENDEVNPSEYECQCPSPMGPYLLEIDEGAASIIHAACGKAPGFDSDLLGMAAMSVNLAWEKPGPCFCEYGCDCDQWATLTPEPGSVEQARRIAVQLEQENARLRELLETVAGRWAEIAGGMLVLAQAADAGDPMAHRRAARAQVLHSAARDVRWILACDSIPHDLRTSQELGETPADGAS
jgi:hypothetical protein